MPKIVDFALPPGGTIVDVAPSNATALDIESAGADYITVDTTGSGSVIIGKTLTLEAGSTHAGDISIEKADPVLTMLNTTASDSHLARDSLIAFKGTQSGGEVSTLGSIRAEHFNASDDQAGILTIAVNDGNDNDAPTDYLKLSANQAEFNTKLKVKVGSAAEPGYAFYNDPNTGIFGDESDAIGISTAGVARLNISATGATTFTIPDNTANALLIEDTTGADYVQCDTTDSNEKIIIGDGLPATGAVCIGTDDNKLNTTLQQLTVGHPDGSSKTRVHIKGVSSGALLTINSGAATQSAEIQLMDGETQDRWSVYKGGNGGSGVGNFVIQGKTGASGAGTTLKSEYVSGKWCLTTDGTGPSSVTHNFQVQDGDIGIVKNSADAVGSKLIFEKSRNATDGSHTAVSDNDVLGTVEFRGSDTNTFEAGASIIGRVQGTPSDGSMPAELAFAVTPSGSTTPVEAMHIRSNGHVGIGDSFPNTKLHVSTNSSSSTAIVYNTSTSGKGAGYSGSMAAYFENKVGPTITLNNATHEDSSGGRETGIHFCGEKANAGEQHTLGALMVSHSGSADDQKGQMVIHLNMGSNDHAPTALHYFDGPTANVGFNSITTAGYRLTLGGNDSNPGLLLKNTSSSNNDGVRISRIDFEGRKADNNTHNLARIQAQHDGSGDDDKGKLTFSVNDGDDGATPSITPLTIYSTGYVGVGTNAPDNAVFNVRQSVSSNPVCQIENTGVGTALRIQSGTDSSSHDIFKVFNGAGAQKFGCRADGPVFVGASSLNGKEFEVNNGSNSIYFDIDSSDNYIVSNQPLSFYGGGATVTSVQMAKYGIQKFRFAMAQSDGTRTSDTNTDQPAYLADSGATIICDLKFGCVGAFTLTADVTHVKFWNVPDLGTAQTITVKIKQHASAPKTISYSTVNIYSDAGSTTKNGSLLWSGGAGHVMSTGVDDIDIVQFTVIPTTTSDRDVYGAVIGQNFS